MGQRVWEFRDADLHRYRVELDHGHFSGKKTITVNGSVAYEGRARALQNTSGEHTFPIGPHSAHLRIWSPDMLRYRYSLTVDGVVMDQRADLPDVQPAIDPGPSPTSPASTARESADDAKRHRELHQRVAAGASWLKWIAGLTAINTVINLLGSGAFFAAGSVIGYLISAFVTGMFGSTDYEALGAVLTFGLALGIFQLSRLASRASVRALLVGSVILVIDGLVMVIAVDWIGIAIHALALFSTVRGWRAARALRRIHGSTQGAQVIPRQTGLPA